MTPIHEKLIDQMLQSADRRVRELLTGSGYQIGREARIEEMRKSPLGQHLANLANYSEGVRHCWRYPRHPGICTVCESLLLWRAFPQDIV
jgi:hypothetical protein